MKDLKKTLKFIVFPFFIVIFLLAIFLFKEIIPKESREGLSFSSKLVSPTVFINNNSQSFNSKSVVVLKKIDDFTYQIIASSDNQNIVGFDFIIEKEAINNSSTLTASSLLSSFSLYQKEKENFLILTGIKKLDFNESTVFNETPIIEFKSTTPIKIKLRDNWEKYTSKLVDSKNNILLPKILLK